MVRFGNRTRRGLSLVALVGLVLTGGGLRTAAHAGETGTGDGATGDWTGGAAAAPTSRAIVFPIAGKTTYTDTFGACRDGCSRSHEGQDLMSAKLTPLVAAVTGEITWVRIDEGNSGNSLRITDVDGWHYLYMHINNDTPGTDNAANPERWRFAPGIGLGSEVKAGQLVAFVGDSGNAEGTGSHLHFEIRSPDYTPINAYASLQAARTATTPPRLYISNEAKASSTAKTMMWARQKAQVLVCDLDGDGDDAPVTYVDNRFSWRHDLDDTAPKVEVPYGKAGDIAVCGDWDGDGTDGIGLFRAGTWYLRNSAPKAGTDKIVTFGKAGDIPVPHDWNGDGKDAPGLVRGNEWLFGDPAGTRVVARTKFGQTGDTFLIGDWDGDGTTEPGYRHGRTIKLRAGIDGDVLFTYDYGLATDKPVVGDADGDGDDAVNVWRPPPVVVIPPATG